MIDKTDKPPARRRRIGKGGIFGRAIDQLIASSAETGRAQALADTLAGIAPVSAWVFARYSTSGMIREAFVDEGAEEKRLLDLLKAERLLAPPDTKVPDLVATAVPLSPYSQGLTLILGSGDTVRALMVLLRDAERGAFSALERRELEAALAPASDALARLQIFDSEESAEERAMQRAQPALYVLADDFSVDYCWAPLAGSEKGPPALDQGRLPPVIEQAVRKLTARWDDDPANCIEDVAAPIPSFIVRTVPLAGPRGIRVGVFIERFKARNSLGWAARRFAMSSRELEVLALLLQGQDTADIAASLNIAESTAHDHVKRMLLKTKSHNRPEMVARALGWRSGSR